MLITDGGMSKGTSKYDKCIVISLLRAIEKSSAIKNKWRKICPSFTQILVTKIILLWTIN